MSVRAPASRVPDTVVGAGLVVMGLYVAAMLFAMTTSTFDAWAALLLAPVLAILTIPALRRQAMREGDPRLFWLLLVALLVKLIGAMVRHYIAFDIYEGRADAGGYHDVGVHLYSMFREGNFDTGLPSLTSTHFISFLTGVVYTFIGPTQLGGFLVYSWLGFWGLFFFYRAFVLAVPEGRNLVYARLLFFLPSLVFWPSSIGKEAWMIFTLGMGALGAAHALSRRTLRGIVLMASGLWLAAIVRPHFAGLMAVALAAAYLVRRQRSELRQLGPIVKVVAFACLAAVAILLVARADRFLRDRDIQTDRGVTGALEATTERTSQGGSEFAPSILDSPARAPAAVVTVLFRPLVFEAHNTQSLIAGIETTFLLLLSLLRLRWLRAALASLRRQPYIAFALVYTGLSIVAMSGFANFGLLARQRVQILPLYLALFVVPSRNQRKPDREEEHQDKWPVPAGRETGA
jgi:hypothetical protein